MNSLKLIRAGAARRSLLPLSVSVLALCTPRLIAATETWNIFTGTNNWSVGTNWLDGTAPAAADITLDAVFGGTGAATYTANNDITNLLLNTLTFTSSSTGLVSISGSPLDFNDDDTPSAINQNGSGAISLDAGINATSSITLGGTGSGVVTINGAISGGGGLTFGGGNWQLTNVGNTFTGAINITAGSFVELRPAGVAPQNVSLALGAATLLGNNGPLTIDGGTLKVTTVGSGNMNVGRSITFGSNGGVLDLTNSNTVNPPTQGGNIAGGDLTLALNNGAGTPAVIKWNGGQVGLSNNNPADGNIATGSNTLRIAALSGTGPLRIELTNGAVLRGSTGGSGTINVPITVRGVIGGDPTSGPAGTVISGISLNMGRYALDSQNVTNHTAGITFQGAVQVSVVGTTRALDGSITVAGTASGAPGFVAFSGRGTGTQLNATLNNPGTNTAGQNPLWIGQGQNDFLTIEDGGVAVFDNRVRTDAGGPNGNGVVLDGTAVLNAGGLLRIQQSISNFTPGVAATTSNVGDVVIRGDIRGEGTTLKESTLEIALPAPQPGSPVSSAVPATLTGTNTVAGERPYGGVRFEDVTGNADFIVNGTGFGGLRINGIPRPNALIQGGAADPVSNASKINDALPVTRLIRVSGTGGYLTIAPLNETYNFPAGGMWSDTDIGLKVVNQNAGGVDVSLAALTTWSRNLAVDTGATLDLGSTNPFIIAGGTLNGIGTVSGTGSLRVDTGANLGPGLGGVGTLVLSTGVQLLGSYLVDVTPTAADAINVGGNLTLGGPVTFSGTYGTTDLTIANYTGTLTGTFSSIAGLSPDFTVDYGTGTNSQIKIVFSVNPTLTWQGSPGGTWSVGEGNWQGAAIFADGNKVVFDDTATGTTTVTISGGNVSPNLITINNTNKTYAITSSPGAAIVGSAQLIKMGSGQLILNGPANYGGGTIINAGTVKLGTSDALPDAGAVSVAAGATLDTQGNSDTIGNLSVDGSVLGVGGTLTTTALTLGDGAVFQPKVVLNGNVTKTGTNGTTLGGAVDLGGASRTFDVAPGTSPELTLNGLISDGGLTKTGNGTLMLGNLSNSYTGGTVVNAGTIFLGGAGAFPTGTSLTVNGGGTFDANSTALNVSSLSGTGGTLSLGGGALTVVQTGNTTFSGAITGSASLTKTGSGVLTLNGAGSDYSGGLFVTGGTVIVGNASGGGTATATVNPGATLQVGSSLTIPINLAGGRLSSQGSPAAVTSNQLMVSNNSTVLLADSTNLATNSEVVITGSLDGTGNLSVSIGTGQTNPDGGVGFRLRGTASTYTGTITANNAVKLEVQTNQPGPFSPAGTGKFVFTGGTFTAGSVNGNYTQFNIRNNSGGDTVFGNDVSITGTGFVNMNLPGTAPLGSKSQMGLLQVGDGQTLGVNRNGTPSQVVAFNSVTLTGGNATFAPQTPTFNVSGTSELSLGPIGESVAGSGFVMNGLSTLYLTGANTYTGTTTIQNGTVRLGAAGALPVGTKVTADAGTLDLSHPTLGSFDQSIAALSGALGVITNSDLTPRTLTIDQAIDAVFGGSFAGTLGITKKGAGKLTLNGASSNSEPIAILGGSVVVNGSVSGAVNGQSGGVLGGGGSVGVATFRVGSKIAPGDPIGSLTLGSGFMDFGATLELDITGTTAGTLYDRLVLNGGLEIANPTLVLNLGTFDPVDFTDQFTIILNNGTNPVDGTFLGLPNGATFVQGGQLWKISYFDDASTPAFELAGGNDVTLLAVPEPGAIASIIGGIGLLLGAQRFRRRF